MSERVWDFTSSNKRKWFTVSPPKPTNAEPGSADKIAVLRQRAERRQMMHVAGDPRNKITKVVFHPQSTGVTKRQVEQPVSTEVLESTRPIQH